jgi:predicted naringenin-chalcone synthase
MWLFGFGGFGLIGRELLRVWQSKNRTSTTGDESQRNLITSLSAEAKKWQEIHEAEKKEWNLKLASMEKQNEDYIELTNQLRIQNAMMRLLLRQQGIDLAELDKLLSSSMPPMVEHDVDEK